MKKICLYFLVLAFVLVSCGNEEPGERDHDRDLVTRPQDGNGKAFLENGKYVEANLNFTEAQLRDALSKYDWERDYCFYYDNTKVYDKSNIGGLPLKMTMNGQMLYDYFSYGDLIKTDIKIKGKLLITEHNPDILSSFYLCSSTYIVVALDISDNSGRIIMDCAANTSEQSTQMVRMIWHAVIPQ